MPSIASMDFVQAMAKHSYVVDFSVVLAEQSGLPPPAMVKGLHEMLKRAGMNDTDIRAEEFAGYRADPPIWLPNIRDAVSVRMTHGRWRNGIGARMEGRK